MVADKKANKQLTGCHTYDILKNPQYVTAFQYYSADLPSRDDFIVDNDDSDENNSGQSDFVRVILNLAFMKPSTILKAQKALKGADKDEMVNKFLDALVEGDSLAEKDEKRKQVEHDIKHIKVKEDKHHH